MDPSPALARLLLGLGIAATLAANVAHGLDHGLIGAAVAAWPAVALVGSYELLMMVIRSSQVQAGDGKRTRCRNRRLNCSPSNLQQTGFLPSVLSYTSASHVRSDFGTI